MFQVFRLHDGTPTKLMRFEFVVMNQTLNSAAAAVNDGTNLFECEKGFIGYGHGSWVVMHALSRFTMQACKFASIVVTAAGFLTRPCHETFSGEEHSPEGSTRKSLSAGVWGALLREIRRKLDKIEHTQTNTSTHFVGMVWFF